ncbi:hypothetical protein M3J09_008224 [Ascochyta lentis]
MFGFRSLSSTSSSSPPAFSGKPNFANI